MKMKKHHILSLAFLVAFGAGMPLYAQNDEAAGKEQQGTVKGKVIVKAPAYPMKVVRGVCRDAATKAPLGGIMVRALGNASYTAMTDSTGGFTIKVPAFSTALYVHAPQYLSQQVGLGAEDSVVQIEMIADKFRPMYGESANILAASSQSISNMASQTIENNLGEVLGGDVRTITRSGGPGYGAAMFIRGLNSVTANAQPLIVVDGIVRDMQQTRTALHYGDYINLMLNINPEDIEKVTVLKNATALYGAKGGNGVILIETKRGHSMATRIDANIGIGISLQPRLPEMMDAGQYRIYASEMLGTYPGISSYTDPMAFKFLVDDPSKYYYMKFHSNTDWTKEVYRTALTQNYNINVQGGDNVGMYNLSLGYTDGQSTAKDNGFNRLNVRFNTDINIVDKLTTRLDMSYAKISRDVFDNGAPEDFTTGTVSSPTFLGLIKSPFLNPYTYNNVTRQLSSTLAGADDFLTVLDADLSLGNPTALLANGNAINKNRVETTNFNTVIAPRYEFSRYLVLNEIFSYTLDRISQRYYRPVGGMPSFLIDGIGRVQNMAMSMFSKETSVMSDTRLQFTNQFGGHSLDAYAGVRYASYVYDNNEPQGQYATAGNDKTPNINKNMDFIDATGIDDSWRSLTWYANADYNYRNRYFVQASLALESCSRFGKEADGIGIGGVKWGVFPSVQLGWALTNETWFPKTKGVNYLLLKAGFDLSGNDDISNYAARTSFSVTKYLWKSTAAQLNNIGNENISWEQTRKLNLGLVSCLLNNRVGIEFNYYRHYTSNLLTLTSFDNPVAGINSYWSNGGALENTGFEFTFTGKPVIARKLNVEMGFSIGHYVNEIKSLPNDSKIYVDGLRSAQGYVTSVYGTDNIATIVGQPVGVFYGYRTKGVFAADTDAAAAGNGGYLYLVDETGARQYFKAGDMHFDDLNGDGEISEADRTIIGNPNPDIYGNIFASICWKKFKLYVGFNYSLGNDVYNYQRSIIEGGYNFYNQTTAMTNRWRAEGQHTDVPRLSYGDPMGNSRFSDRWIENGSYLRLKTLRMVYQVPVELSWLPGLSVWAEAGNLFTLTRYLGSDPEFSVGNSVLCQGIDAGNVALGRTFTLGLKINL